MKTKIYSEALAVFEEIKQYLPQPLERKPLVAVGCSTSAVLGSWMGTTKGENASLAAAEEIWAAAREAWECSGIDIAVQCCEHLNRAVVVHPPIAERMGARIVHAVPSPQAGGAFAAHAWQSLSGYGICLAEQVQADVGIDIGGVLIGTQVRPVAVPIKLTSPKIGEARVIAAYSRPPLIGGERAGY